MVATPGFTSPEGLSEEDRDRETDRLAEQVSLLVERLERHDERINAILDKMGEHYRDDT